MEYKAHEYQRHATEHIINNNYAGLFLEMGLGKTVSTLTAIEYLMYQELEVTKVLVIAPLRVAKDVWSDEIEKWEHLKHLTISKVIGSEKVRLAALSKKADVYVINRENVKWLVDLCGKDFDFDMVVIDELSSFKATKSQRFKALRKVRPKMKRVVGLTGTPAPNSLLDLWPQVYLLDQGKRLEPYVTHYRERYFLPDGGDGNITYNYRLRKGAKETIEEKIKDICMSMTTKDYLTLPELRENTIKVKLSKQEMKQYETMEKEAVLELDEGELTAVSAAVLAGKLLQMANGACYDEDRKVIKIHDGKLNALEEIIEEACSNPVLVFYSYKHDLERIKERFRNVRELKTTEDMRDWNNEDIPILAAHPASTGHGLNLQQGGHIIVWFGIPWSLELYQQANARLYRQGQKKSVIVHHIVSRGTLDEKVMKVLASKEKGQDSLMEAVKARIEKYGGME